MAAPVITFTDDHENVITSLDFGTVDAGTISSETEIHIYNNRLGTINIADAINCSITSKTYGGLDSGDTIQYGQEILDYQIIEVKNTSLENPDTVFGKIGGSQVFSIGANVRGTIPSSPVGSNFAILKLRANVPSYSTAVSATFLLKIQYQFY